MDNDYQDMNLFDFILLCIRKLKSFFVWCLNLFCACVRLGCKYWYVMCLFVILSVLFAKFCCKPSQETFTGEATIVFPPSMKPVIEHGLQTFSINNLTSEILIYNIIDAKNDGFVDFTDKKSEVTSEDSIKFVMMDRLAIEITLPNKSDFADYEKSIASHFNGNQEYCLPAKRWRESLERKIEYINNVIENSDTFSLELFDECEILAETLASTPEVVNFQTHFLPKPNPMPNPKKKYVYSVLVALILGLSFCMAIENRKTLHEYFQRKR